MPTPRRTELVDHVASLVGREIQIEDVGNGWPAFAEIEVGDRLIPVAMYVGAVYGTGRGNPAERRFQNPASGRPIQDHPGRQSVLVGLWADDAEIAVPVPVLVFPEVDRRIGKVTRWSMFVSTATLENATANGWATQITSSGEHVACFHPSLLPLAIASRIADVEPDEREVQRAVQATRGSAQRKHAVDDRDSASRLRRAVSVLVRDTWFRGDVLDAYDHRCAMCGLGLNLVQGAHIYPASAPNSPDVVPNGIALCANHHLAFDRHAIAVLPPDMDVLFRPDILDQAEVDPTARAFVESNYSVLSPPHRGADVDPEMLILRYAYFADNYDWLCARS